MSGGDGNRLRRLAQGARRFRERRRARRREGKRARELRELDPEARDTIERVRPYTMLGPGALFAWIEAVRYVARAGIPGDLVECGVWRGGAVMAAALTLRQLGAEGRRIWLYDTFTGMTRPGDQDVDLLGKEDPASIFAARRTGNDSSAWCDASEADVRANLAQVDTPAERFVLVPGRVEETIPRAAPERIAALRLDTDWYESTRHEMEHLMPRLSPGGVLVVDDYFKWAGNRSAVDEWMARHQRVVLLTKVELSAIGVVR
ncbi:MAG: class I SAM-dependent methyltransferase [Deltaproteobacteria bacterium]|nr:class I SAM-dependent methyltransferase [Deltaproteobacteria bacterium]